MSEPLTRRAALAAGLSGAAALALGPAAATARGPDEGAALAALARNEEVSAYVYRTVGVGGLADVLSEQEDEHAKALAVQLEALGLPSPPPARGRDGLPPAALRVLGARGSEARLRAAIAWEQALIDGCARRLAALEEPGAIRTVATIMAGHAQHQAMLRRLAGLDPLSSDP